MLDIIGLFYNSMSINRTLTEEMIAQNITTRQEIVFYMNKTNFYPDSTIAALHKLATSYEARDVLVSKDFN